MQMRIPMAGQFNAMFLAPEIIYTLLISFFCFLIFFKTRELYLLSKHKGIGYFRYAFMFFGIAYISRLLMFLILFSTNTTFKGSTIRMGIIPISNLIVAFFSTMAILYLTYSTIWKKINSEQFITFANIIALLVGILAFILRTPLSLSLIQLFLMIIASIIILTNHKKAKKNVRTKILYLLIFTFWFISTLVLQSANFISTGLKLIFQILSLGVFLTIYYKVSKWLK